MTTVIAVPVLAEADAIGADVLGMAECLERDGQTVLLAAEKSTVPRDVLPLEHLLQWRDSGDRLIYHHSIGNELGARVVRNWSGPTIVKYHNVTPPRFFEGEMARAAEAGIRQAAELEEIASFWVDSEFNAGELRLDSARVLPPFMPTESLLVAAPDADFATRLSDWATTLLCVGRVAPNKNIILAVDALAEYRRRFDDTARLVIAGRHVFAEYSETVAERIRSLGLRDCVAVTGRISAEQLKSLYLAADALLVTSEHEGFCVPLVEAMSLGVPTVAVPHAAIPETAGDFACYAEPHAAAVAEAVHGLVSDPASREAHLLRGRRRFRSHFTQESIGKRFLELLATT